MSKLYLCSDWRGPTGCDWLVAAADPLPGKCWHHARYLVSMVRGEREPRYGAYRLGPPLPEGWQYQLDGLPDPSTWPELQPGELCAKEDEPSGVEVLRVSPGDKEVLALCERLEHHRETLKQLVDGQGVDAVPYERVCGVLYRREPWLFSWAGDKPEDGAAKLLTGEGGEYRVIAPSPPDPEADVRWLVARYQDRAELMKVAQLLLARLAPERLSRLMGALADNVAELPDEELLAECQAAGRDPAIEGENFRAKLTAIARGVGRCRR